MISATEIDDRSFFNEYPLARADESDDAMDPPLCWITNDFDRSPSELLWVNSDRA